MGVPIGDLGGLLLALVTAISLFYISRQLNITRKQTKGEFLLALDDQFEKTNPITARLVNDPTFVPSGSEWGDVFRLMSVFERINIMVEDKILDVGLVNRLHSFRLLSIIANDAIYERIQSTGAEWQDFIDLCYAIANHRQRQVSGAGSDKAFIERVHKLSKQTRRIRNPFSFQ